MSVYSVGSIVESVCGKCNDVMGHTIMAIVGGDIVKVECRVCKSQHKYRPPARAATGKTTLTMKKGRGGEPVASRQTAMTKASRPAAPKAPSRKLSAAVAQQEAWQAMVRRHGGETPRPYAMAETFARGEFVSHPVFGLGEVSSLAPPDKMDVLFEAGVKRLLCNKK